MGMYHALLLIGIVVLIAVYDVVMIKVLGKKASISAWGIKVAYKYPSVVFIIGLGIGIVFGHLVWRMKTLDVYECQDTEVQEIIMECSVKSEKGE